MSTGEMEQTPVSAADAEALRAELLRRRLAGRGTTARRRSGIPRADRDRPLKLSHGQQQLWFLDRLAPESGEYHVPVVLRLRGALDADALDTAWQRLLDRHEILRTRYGTHGDDPVQVIDPPRPSPLERTDVTDDAQARALIEADLARPFDLAAAWPVRARLLRITDDEHVLALVLHHIACDAWSVGVVGQELGELYRGTEPAPLPVQYADYAAWQHTELTGPAVDRHLAYWKEQLADLPPLELPADRPRPAVRDSAGDSVPFTVPGELADRLRTLAHEHDATLFMTFLAAWQTLLSRTCGRDDIAVGTVVSGRGRPELQQLVGYGINSLVMRGRLDGDPTFADLLARTRATVLDAYDHQDLPFTRVVEELQPERDLSRTPLFQVAFTLHGERTAAFDLPGVTVSPYEGSSRIAKFDLDLQLKESADGTLSGHIEYATALFDRATAERMTDHLLRLLTAVTADPKARLATVDFVGPEERALLIDPTEQTPVTRRVHEVFEEQVGRTPDAVAVSFEGVELSYAE
ncbi:condensation domain-containing protein, partial [Streptomyces sp. NPDC005811]|uniref:condensation domain-containing protein n=1 Tax=Streptomyces sp. NPDC005811 TaxID=3154565 RepID=UPI0033FE89EA